MSCFPMPDLDSHKYVFWVVSAINSLMIILGVLSSPTGVFLVWSQNFPYNFHFLWCSIYLIGNQEFLFWLSSRLWSWGVWILIQTSHKISLFATKDSARYVVIPSIKSREFLCFDFEILFSVSLSMPNIKINFSGSRRRFSHGILPPSKPALCMLQMTREFQINYVTLKFWTFVQTFQNKRISLIFRSKV